MNEAIMLNKKYSERYHQKKISEFIPKIIENYLKSNKIKKIVDLGCGEGIILKGISKKYPKKELYGIDISPRRIKEVNKIIQNAKIFCGDVSNTKLKKNFFDLVISTQVIEHVPNDKKFIKEIKRITKKGGYVYITSVIKKPWAVYIYKNRHKKFSLDPTHEREYASKEEFLKLFKDQFDLIKLKIYPVKRKKIITLRIPGYFIIETIWRKK